MKKAAAILLTLGMTAQAGAQELDLLAKFRGGIGVIPASSGAGTANADGTLPNVRLNVVRGVAPAGGPWTVADLKAEIRVDGRIKVRGRGLLLAGGNSIGQNGNQRVFASLSCGAGTTFVEHSTDTAGVPLEPNGDFRISDTLSPLPSDCPNPVLLIRSSNNGSWFAAGIPSLGDDES